MRALLRISRKAGWWLGVFAALLASSLHARPIVLEEAQKIVSPDPSYDFDVRGAAIDGRTLLAPGFRAGHPTGQVALFHFERDSSGVWNFQGIVATLSHDSLLLADVALQGDVAVFSSGHPEVLVLERSANGWSSTPLQAPGSHVSQVGIVGGAIASSATQ